ncbi:MAG: hypothetical protein B6D39_07150 [Anaerolineae bacterium UTCFX2]|jgi:hypothetical protein|nr:hypothetical protein [Anaerolineae bacterium]MCZ7552888.1 hypothetical protein [Anaerolineales bacterium]OQY91444.1 MAG: hypothetical protein B6D39_07150 [Anaerolineae bacterium UTCFX2]
MVKFPTVEWIRELDKKLNADPDHTRIAHHWEWDLKIIIEPDGTPATTMDFVRCTRDVTDRFI